MVNRPIEVFNLFRQSMLSKTNDWMNLISEDISLIGPLAEVNGRESFIEVNKPFFESIRGGEVYKIIESENYVITQILTNVEAPTGKIISLKICEWYEVEENKIISLKVYFDTTELINEMKAV